MPRYFFAVHSTDGRQIADEEGLHLPDDAAAQAYAAETIHQLNQTEPEAFLGWSIEIRTEDGRFIERLPFVETINSA